MDFLSYNNCPEGLRQPTLIFAFAGWADAADSATHALKYLVRSMKGEKFAEIEMISIQDSDITLTAKRLENDWVMVDRSYYPVSAEAVRNILVGLAELRLKEPKTERKILYSKLQVENVTEKEAKSKLLTVKDKSGKTLAALIVGKETSEIAGASDVGRYIRKPGETLSWLAEGRLELPDAVKDWVSPQFLNVHSKRVNTVSVAHPDAR